MIRRTFLLLALAATGCATTPRGRRRLPKATTSSTARFSQKGLARVSHLPGGSLQVNLLEKHKGSFQLRPTGGSGVKITNDQIPLANISRSLAAKAASPPIVPRPPGAPSYGRPISWA